MRPRNAKRTRSEGRLGTAGGSGCVAGLRTVARGRRERPAPGCAHRTDRRHGKERGSGTVLAAALGMVVMIVMAGLLLIAQAAVQASRAATAADLAALAGADAARGVTSGDPCGVAAATAERHHALLSRCLVQGGDTVEVNTELRERTIIGAATGRSRAGPPP